LAKVIHTKRHGQRNINILKVSCGNNKNGPAHVNDNSDDEFIFVAGFTGIIFRENYFLRILRGGISVKRVLLQKFTTGLNVGRYWEVFLLGGHLQFRNSSITGDDGVKHFCSEK